jgi:hypothetical protein
LRSLVADNDIHVRDGRAAVTTPSSMGAPRDRRPVNWP